MTDFAFLLSLLFLSAPRPGFSNVASLAPVHCVRQ